MRGHAFSTLKTAYMRNLVKLQVLQEDTPDSIIRIPREYCTDFTPSKVSWTLHSSLCNNAKNVLGRVYMHIIPIEHRRWGEADWQWQTCVSTGGILSILTNYCETNTVPPELDKTYLLQLDIQ